MKCSACGFEFESGATCPACGAPASSGQPQPMPPPAYAPPPYAQQPQYAPPPYGQPQYAPPPAYTQPTTVVINSQPQEIMSEKSRTVFAILAFFLGGLGIHEFYIGKVGNGIATIIANFLCSPFLVAIFVGIDVLTTHRDSEGHLLQDDKSVLPAILGIIIILANLLIGPFIIFCFILPILGAASGGY